ESLSILGSAPTEVTAHTDLNIMIKLLQGRAYNMLRDPAARLPLAEAEQLANSTMPNLIGEIQLAKGGLQYTQNQYSAAEQSFQSALQSAHQHNQQLLVAKALGSLGRLFTARGYYDQALDWSAAALSISRSINAHHVEAIVLLNMGWSYWELGDF